MSVRKEPICYVDSCHPAVKVTTRISVSVANQGQTELCNRTWRMETETKPTPPYLWIETVKKNISYVKLATWYLCLTLTRVTILIGTGTGLRNKSSWKCLFRDWDTVNILRQLAPISENQQRKRWKKGRADLVCCVGCDQVLPWLKFGSERFVWWKERQHTYFHRAWYVLRAVTV